MTCDEVSLRTGRGPVTAIVCRRGGRPARRCGVPGCSKTGARLCDHPVVRGGRETTCDRPMCDGHSVAVAPHQDYCEAHARHAKVRPFVRQLFRLWCSYLWRTETFDRALPGERQPNGDHIPHPHHRWEGTEHAQKVRRELGLGDSVGGPEHKAADALTHRGVCEELKRAGWTSRGARLIPPPGCGGQLSRKLMRR